MARREKIKGAKAAAMQVARLLAMQEYGAAHDLQVRQYERVQRTVGTLADFCHTDADDVYRQLEAEAKRMRSTRVMRGPGAEF